MIRNIPLVSSPNDAPAVQSYNQRWYDSLASYFGSESISHTCIPQEPLQVSLADSKLLQMRCTIEKMSDKINQRYISLMEIGTEIQTAGELWFTDYSTAIQKLNSIETQGISLLQQNGYHSWNDELIEKLRKSNSLFDGLIKKIIAKQTDFSLLNPYVIDKFFDWPADVALAAKLKIASYVHARVRDIYANRFEFHPDNEDRFRDCIVLFAMYQSSNRDDLLFLLSTKSFKRLKSTVAMQEIIARESMRLEGQEKSVDKDL